MKYRLILLALILGTSAASMSFFYAVQQGVSDAAIMTTIIYGCYLGLLCRLYDDCQWWDDQEEGAQ